MLYEAASKGWPGLRWRLRAQPSGARVVAHEARHFGHDILSTNSRIWPRVYSVNINHASEHADELFLGSLPRSTRHRPTRATAPCCTCCTSRMQYSLLSHMISLWYKTHGGVTNMGCRTGGLGV